MTTSEGAPAATAPPGEDVALWAAARDGDPEAFAELYHRHADPVWRHAHRLTGSPTCLIQREASMGVKVWLRPLAFFEMSSSAGRRTAVVVRSMASPPEMY